MFNVGDRVIMIRQNGNIPIGAIGTCFYAEPNYYLAAVGFEIDTYNIDTWTSDGQCKGYRFGVVNRLDLDLFVDSDPLPKGHCKPFDAKADQDYLWQCVVSSSTR